MPEMNNEGRPEEEIRMDEAIRIGLCDDHWSHLRQSLLEIGLGQYMSEDSTEMTEQMMAGTIDPMLAASTTIIRVALLSLGLDAIIQSGGCPLCTFRDIVPLITDSTAKSYLRSN